MEKRPSVRQRRTPYAASIGAIFTILAVVGLIAVIYLTLGMTKNALDNSKKRAEFEKMLLPVVMFDPVPFENIKDVDSLSVLQSALWSTLLGEKRGSFQYDEMKLMLVPASDIDVAAARLFGSDAKLEHQSFGDYNINYIYEEDLKAYRVPLTGEVGYYTPRVTKIVKKGDTLQLEVGYIPPTNVWTAGQTGEAGKIEPDKYMIYELRKSGKSYYLAAIRDIDGSSIMPGIPEMPQKELEVISSSQQSGESEPPEESGSSSESSSDSGSSSAGESSSSSK